MFDRIGRFAARFRYPLVLFWLVPVVLVVLFAPRLDQVVTSDQSEFLPADEPSVVAARVAAEYFPEQASPAQAVLVVESTDGPIPSAYLAELTRWLEEEMGEQVGQVLSPTDPALADRLLSSDRQVAMLFVGLPGSIEDQATLEALEAMQARLDAAPAGLRGYVTGSVAIADDYKSSALESADRTTLITIALVVAILLIIYRSPVSPLVPLTTIGAAYLISRGLVAWLATWGWTVSSITDVFMVVLLFGAGTDYCLFLVSRFREALGEGSSGPDGARHTLARVGETIASSAGTVIVGMLAMSFADMRLFAGTGPSLALAVGVTLLAGLTLTPALLAVLGRWAFWPGGTRQTKEGRFWGRLAHQVTSRPWLPLLLTLAGLIPLAVYGSGQQRTFDMLADLPDDVPSKAGFLLLEKNFGAGEMQPLEVILTEVSDPLSPAGLAHLEAVTRDLVAVEGVADLRSLTRPAGRSSPEAAAALRVEAQLARAVESLEALAGPTADPTALLAGDPAEAQAGLEALARYLDDLGTAFPELADDADHRAAVAALADLRTALEEGRQRLLVHVQVEEAAAGVSTARTMLPRMGNGSPDALGLLVERLAPLRSYLAGLGKAHPAIAEMPAYGQALAALDRLEATAADLARLGLLQVQLETVAEQVGALAQAAQVDPMALLDPNNPAAAGQLSALHAYLVEVGTAYPTLTGDPNYQTALALLEQVEVSPGAMGAAPPSAEALAGLQQALSTLAQACSGLAATVGTTMPKATFAPETPLFSEQQDLPASFDAILADLEEALEQLAEETARTLPQATYLPAEDPTGAFQQEMAQVLAQVEALRQSLNRLAETFAGREDGFFLPSSMVEQNADLARLLETYVAREGQAVRLQVILADEPFSPEAMDTVAHLREQVQHAGQGYISGGTATYLDIRRVIERDTWRVMGLVVAGILVVLVLLLRSLVAPIYLIATILLSYGATLGLTRLVFDGILHQGLTWFVPFLIFVVLVALGMDYNIFLMGRVKEELAEHDTRRAVERALERTGGIITSAGIIMAGTFAAMLSSSLLGLVQLAFAVTVGMLLDTFVLRTALVPALATLLGRWNWWPGRR